MFITLEQIRAGRALLRWTQKDLAARAGLNDDQVHNFEGGRSRSLEVLEAIHRAFSVHGIEFTDGEGVRRKINQVYTLTGRDGFLRFFDDVYEVAKTHKNPDICVTNTNEEIYDKWLGDYVSVHEKRMENINVRPRVLIRSGDLNLSSAKYCVYRSVPENQFVDDVPLYIYGDKSSFVEFQDDNVIVTVVENRIISESLRKLFEVSWRNSLEN